MEGSSGYHHGNLRAALLRAGLELSRADGAHAIVLREATRRAGVTARAAYRHFADREALVRAVAVEALQSMASSMLERQRDARTPLDLLEAVGEGYITFALDEPGWFDVAFFAMDDMGAQTHPPEPVPGPSPFDLLLQALEGLVEVGVLHPDRIESAVTLCWSGVHGFATLATRGPLRETSREEILAQGRALLADLVRAVASDAPAAGIADRTAEGAVPR